MSKGVRVCCITQFRSHLFDGDVGGYRGDCFCGNSGSSPVCPLKDGRVDRLALGVLNLNFEKYGVDSSGVVTLVEQSNGVDFLFWSRYHFSKTNARSIAKL